MGTALLTAHHHLIAQFRLWAREEILTVSPGV